MLVFCYFSFVCVQWDFLSLAKLIPISDNLHTPNYWRMARRMLDNVYNFMDEMAEHTTFDCGSG
jgi:hypothetical protein